MSHIKWNAAQGHSGHCHISNAGAPSSSVTPSSPGGDTSESTWGRTRDGFMNLSKDGTELFGVTKKSIPEGYDWQQKHKEDVEGCVRINHRSVQSAGHGLGGEAPLPAGRRTRGQVIEMIYK